MTKGAFANEDVMEEYLSALLTEEAAVVVADNVQRESVARLLETVETKTVTLEPEVATPVIEALAVPEPIAEPEPPVVEPAPVIAPVPEVPESKPVVEIVPEVQPQALEVDVPEPPAAAPEEEHFFSQEFQALFFSVAGLTLAVPLTELGGIHNLEKPGPLFGKPKWFKGVMLHREEKLNVVDTAMWVMPEKCDEALEESIDYQYLIMLDESGWGLACEQLVNTVTLRQEDVKWREGEGGKRPWLAGLVKEKMCALLDVKQLIAMLNKGLGSNDK